MPASGHENHFSIANKHVEHGDFESCQLIPSTLIEFLCYVPESDTRRRKNNIATGLLKSQYIDWCIHIPSCSRNMDKIHCKFKHINSQYIAPEIFALDKCNWINQFHICTQFNQKLL